KRNVFIIFRLLDMIHTGIVLDNDKWDNSILDGEYIFLEAYNKFLFMAFDCLYKSNTDVRPTISFLSRLAEAENVVANCFVLKSHQGVMRKPYDGKFDIPLMLKHFSDDLKKYMDSL